MFRVNQFIKELLHPTPIRPKRNPPGPVVIWNLIRRCNLTCKHCYSVSTNTHFSGELDTNEVLGVMDDLRSFGVPVLVLSGGEPLMRHDIFEISHAAKQKGFYTALSTNGTLISPQNIGFIKEVNYDYLGISIDGLRDTHDKFRQKEGAFDASLDALRLCHNEGIKTGLRFTLTQQNAREFPHLLQIMEDEHVDKFFLSHLNYGGRGNKNRSQDAYFETTRQAMEMLFETVLKTVESGSDKEFVTGNNDADGVYFYHWAREHFPEQAEHIRQKLAQWGGNSAGVNIANIDNLGNVHPDTFWWDHSLGNVRDRPFSEIWQDTSDPLMAGFKARPRKISGRCGQCAHFDICGGNSRIRALQLYGDAWAEDPGCYLNDDEIGIESPAPADSSTVPA
jgi:heme d1 biosynthesis radical SAM protein NirJ